MRFGLRATVVLSLIAILTGVGLLFSLVTLRLNERLLLQEAASGCQATMTVVVASLEDEQGTAPGAGQEVGAGPQALQRAVEHLAQLPRVLDLVVFGPDLTALAHSDPAALGQRILDPEVAPTFLEELRRGEVRRLDDGRRVYMAYAPIYWAAQPVAVLRATFSLDSLDQQLAGAQGLMLLYLALDVLLLLLVGSYLLERVIVRPLQRIASATERVGEGALDPIPVIESGNEIGRLAVSFNRMVSALGRKRRSLQETIAQLKRSNAELETARRSMVRAERLASVGTLAAGVAHEVGNPLAAILGFTELLLEPPPEGGEPLLDEVERIELIRRIHEQTLRIHGTIRELLSYSRARPPSGLLPARVQLAEAVGRATSLMEPQPRFRGITLDVRVPKGLPPAAIESNELEQVLVNLLLNAADALGGAGRVEVTAEELLGEPGALRLVVEDDGPGIDPQARERVFDPFFTTKEPGKGTGLGLAICERILNDAGGEIALDSAPGEGTRVIVTLPRATTLPAAPDEAAQS